MTRMQSTVSLVIVDDRNARMQLKDIRMGSANRQVEQPRDLLPWEHFDAVELNEVTSILLIIHQRSTLAGAEEGAVAAHPLPLRVWSDL